MHEDVGPTIDRSNESPAFGDVEPLASASPLLARHRRPTALADRVAVLAADALLLLTLPVLLVLGSGSVCG